MVQMVNPLQSVQQGQQFVDGLFTQRANKQAGGLLASGNSQGAANTLYRSGDLAGGRQIATQAASDATAARTQRTADSARQLQTTMQVVKALKVQRDAGQDLTAALASYRPTFLAMGTNPQEFDQIAAQVSANPAFLDQVEALTAQAMEYELRAGADGDTVAVGLNPLTGQTSSSVAYSAPREAKRVAVGNDFIEVSADGTVKPLYQGAKAPEYRSVRNSDGTETIVQVGGRPGGVIGESGAPSGGGSGNSVPRGIRNNNPGNIEDGPFARSLPGYAGSDGRFAIFNDLSSGEGAQTRLLGSYVQRGFDTPAEIINRWAPPSDNNPTGAYIRYVARRAGIGPNDRVTEDKIPLIAQAIREFENGSRSPSNGASAAPATSAGGGAVVVAQGENRGPQVAQLSPQEVAALGLPEGTVAQRKQDGSINVVSRGGAERYTDGQRGSAAFAFRLRNAAQSLDNLAQNGVARPSPAILAFGNGQLQENALNSTDRRWLQAAREWLAPVLRKDTGAAVGPGELVTYMGIYLPSPTDDQATLQQKAQARRVAEQALRAQAGGAYNEMFPQATPPSASRPRTNAPGLRFNVTEAQLQTRQRVVGEGGRPTSPLGSTQNPRYLNPSDPRSSYNNVRSGEYYVAPDGQLRRKP